MDRDQIIREITNPVEAIVNLIYLIKHDRQNPDAVLKYVDVAELQARCLIEIIQRNGG